MSDYISQDLVVLILKRLPVKNLLRFKSVCKLWKQLIESPSFTHQHLAIQSHRFIVQDAGENHLNILDPHVFPLISNVTVTIPDRTKRAVFVSTAHGVVCYMDALANLVILWNPSIRQLFRFPLPCGTIAYSHYRGFWIDPSKDNEFKVVVFNLTKYENVAVFSSRKRAWMEVGMDHAIRDDDDHYEPNGTSRQLMVDGVAYWKASYLPTKSMIIIFFDFEQDRFGAIELPSSLRGKKCVNICRWRGSLSVVQWNSNGYSLWVMQNGSWSKMFSFNPGIRLRNVLCPLEESWGRVLAVTRSHDMVLCDPYSKVNITLNYDLFCRAIVAYDFVESLVFPDPKCVSNL